MEQDGIKCSFLSEGTIEVRLAKLCSIESSFSWDGILSVGGFPDQVIRCRIPFDGGKVVVGTKTEFLRVD